MQVICRKIIITSKTKKQKKKKRKKKERKKKLSNDRISVVLWEWVRVDVANVRLARDRPIISSRGRSRIFFRRGCTRLLLYFNTNKPHSFCRIPVVLENRGSSRGGGGGGGPPPPPPHPLHPFPRSAPEFSIFEITSCLKCLISVPEVRTSNARILPLTSKAFIRDESDNFFFRF